MKKYNEDGKHCSTCMGDVDCYKWMEEIKIQHCLHNQDKAYANKEECEALLKYWNNKDRI